MTSTVLDGLLCLLLISAAVVAVTTATPREPAGGGHASDVAGTLATTTATVNYTLTPRFGTTSVDGAGSDDALARTAHGTLAGLLGRAAVARITVGDERLWHARDDFERAVVGAVEAAVRANHTQITAVWRPYPGSSMSGRLVLGDQPPPDRPVHAATVEVPSGFPTRERAVRRAARERGIGGVADAVAAGVVEGLFPPTRTRIAAGSASPSAALVRHRYRRVATRLDASAPAELEDGGVDAANDRLAASLSEQVKRDLHRTNTSATAAADAVRLGCVRIVVRTWP